MTLEEAKQKLVHLGPIMNAFHLAEGDCPEAKGWVDRVLRRMRAQYLEECRIVHEDAHRNCDCR